MRISGLNIDLQQLPAPLPIYRGAVRPDEWLALPAALAETGGRLVSVWGTDRRHDKSGGFSVAAAYAVREGLVWLDLQLAAGTTAYPDLSPLFPFADRMQRAMADLLGLRAEGQRDLRPWLNHGAWPPQSFPLRQEAPGPEQSFDRPVDDYAFVRVEGDGVHEIPVGPVHAGIIEPGHFRFSVVGEKVLRLEERLGYAHKGIEKRFTQLAPLQAHRLAGRVSGDSTVAYCWAYCMALESAAGVEISERSAWLRALMLERERVANHLGDLGALGNDAALVFGLAQFMRLKEDWLRLNDRVFGHRFMMDRIVPGGVEASMDASQAEAMARQAHEVEGEVQTLRNVFDDHAGLQDRFITTGRVTSELARRLGLAGLAGRASAQPYDLRVDFPCEPYGELDVKKVVYKSGDVAARVNARFDELAESLRLVRAILLKAPEGEAQVELPQARPGAFGVGWIEGWRGEVFVALEAGEENRIRRGHAHDPSWQGWPLIEHAVSGHIGPHFPLINNSFHP